MISCITVSNNPFVRTQPTNLKVHLQQLVRPLHEKRRANVKMKTRESLLLRLKNNQRMVVRVWGVSYHVRVPHSDGIFDAYLSHQ